MKVASFGGGKGVALIVIGFVMIGAGLFVGDYGQQ